MANSGEVSQTEVARVTKVETQDGFSDQNPATRHLASAVSDEYDAMVNNISREIQELFSAQKKTNR